MHVLTYYTVIGITATAISVVLWNSLSHRNLWTRSVRIIVSVLAPIGIFVALWVSRHENESYRWNLSYANLRGHNFYGRRDLKSLNLTQSVFDGANLRRADLTNSALVRASFDGADLRDAILDGANLTDAYLSETNLEPARLYKSLVKGADFSKANVSKTDFGHGSNLEGANFSGANLSGSGLRQARLRYANRGRILVGPN